MWFRSFLKSQTRSSRGRQQSAAGRKLQARRLLLEGLEDRCLLTFITPVSYPGGAPLVVADFNVDGVPDLVAGDSYLGNGDGTFRFASSYVSGGDAVADFNLDGWPDVLSERYSSFSQLGPLYLGHGDGTFEQGEFFSYGQSVAVGDLNNDGKPDAVVALKFEDELPVRLVLFLGNGDGTFAPPQEVYLPGAYGEPRSVAVGDLDTDGILDVVVANDTSGYVDYTVTVMRGAGGVSNLPGYGGSSDSTRSLEIADVNGDNLPDIISTIWSSDEVLVNLGTGNGNFAGPVSYAAGAAPHSPAVADVNGDHLPDLVIANEGRGAGKGLNVLLGRGDGTFGVRQYFAMSGAVQDVGVGDFNGDGFNDVTAAGEFWDGNAWVSSAAVLINDGIWTPPPPSAPVISIGDAVVAEGNTGTVAAIFTISLSAASSETITVDYATANDAAGAGSDYQADSGTLTFAPGETTKTISVFVNGDRRGEPNETFLVNLGDPKNAVVLDWTGIGTILDDEPIVSIGGYFSDVEGNTGTKALTFTVSLSSEYDMPVTVDYSTADLTPDEQDWYGPGATAGDDYTAAVGTVTFPAHTTASQTITVLVNGDRVSESDELFFVNLSNPSSALLGAAQALGNIANDEPYVWNEGGLSIPEGNSGTTAMTFTLRLSVPYDIPVTVDYTTVDGSAIAGSDYQAASGTLTIPAGQNTGTIAVLVNGDATLEPDETFYVNLSNASGATIVHGQGDGKIVNDDVALPSLTISDVSRNEGRSGTTAFSFTVTLSAPSSVPVTVQHATANGTATTASNDYVAQSGTLTFLPGQTSKTITISVKGDKTKEANETFFVNLSGAIGAEIADGQGQGTILNDDGGNTGGKKASAAAAVDAAIEELMFSGSKKRDR